MIYSIYSIKDERTGYLEPMLDINDASAMRNFHNAILKKGSLFDTHSSDYSLFKIGEFNNESGTIKPFELEFICSASSLKEV